MSNTEIEWKQKLLKLKEIIERRKAEWAAASPEERTEIVRFNKSLRAHMKLTDEIKAVASTSEQEYGNSFICTTCHCKCASTNNMNNFVTKKCEDCDSEAVRRFIEIDSQIDSDDDDDMIDCDPSSDHHEYIQGRTKPLISYFTGPVNQSRIIRDLKSVVRFLDFSHPEYLDHFLNQCEDEPDTTLINIYFIMNRQTFNYLKYQLIHNEDLESESVGQMEQYEFENMVCHLKYLGEFEITKDK